MAQNSSKMEAEGVAELMVVLMTLNQIARIARTFCMVPLDPELLILTVQKKKMIQVHTYTTS